jgi:lysocardiolipin and lysophospholipid acyltransferase
MHLRLFDVRKEVPLGDLSSSPLSPTANGRHNLVPPSPGLAPPSPGILSPTTPAFSPVDPFHPPTGRLSRAEREKDMDPTPQEAALFEQWLRKVWREKDARLERYLTTGMLGERPKANVRDSGVSVEVATESGSSRRSGEVEVPVELRSKWEILDAFAIFGPALVWAVWNRTF